MSEEEKITQWFINNINGTPSEEQLALRKVYELQDRIDKAIEIMYDKGTFNLDNEYGKVFAELLDILKGEQ